MLPPETACPQCRSLIDTSVVLGDFPALLGCPACGLPIDELRARLEEPRPRESLDADLSRREGGIVRWRAVTLEAHQESRAEKHTGESLPGSS